MNRFDRSEVVCAFGGPTDWVPRYIKTYLYLFLIRQGSRMNGDFLLVSNMFVYCIVLYARQCLGVTFAMHDWFSPICAFYCCRLCDDKRDATKQVGALMNVSSFQYLIRYAMISAYRRNTSFTVMRCLLIILAEQQPVGRWARTRGYETPRTMKTNCIDKTINRPLCLVVRSRA